MLTIIHLPRSLPSSSYYGEDVSLHVRYGEIEVTAGLNPGLAPAPFPRMTAFLDAGAHDRTCALEMSEMKGLAVPPSFGS